MNLNDYINSLHVNYGYAIPSSLYTLEMKQLFYEYKEKYKDDWLTDDYIWVLGNIDHFNHNIYELTKKGD